MSDKRQLVSDESLREVGGPAALNVAMLRAILEHLPDDLPVHVAGRGEVVSARRTDHTAGMPDGLHLDVRGPMLRGLFRDQRTLRVRLEALAS